MLVGFAYADLIYLPVLLPLLPDSAVVVEATLWVSIYPLLLLSLIVTLALHWKSRLRRKLILVSLADYTAVFVVSEEVDQYFEAIDPSQLRG